jgi:hypothetical protein
MSKNISKAKTAPVIACHSSTAAALGAVLVRDRDDAKRLGPACIPIRGNDGSYWMWPLERAFLAAIERQ